MLGRNSGHANVGADKIRYFLFINGRWRWRPTKAMRDRDPSFVLVTMGKGGPGLDSDGNPAASAEDKAKAIKLNEDWDHVRRGLPRPVRTEAPQWPEGSVGHGYERAMRLRLAERLKKGKVWTKEQESRDDWPRAWKWIGPKFGDCLPSTIETEHFLRIDKETGQVSGLVAEIEQAISITERHRVIKVWRALWKRMKAMGGYCDGKEDPTKAFENGAPDPRQEVWQRREVLHRVQRAWRMGYYGLAACIAVAWDSMLSPVDARGLTPSQVAYDASGMWFDLDRAKTGRAAAATLTPWSQAILMAYLKKLAIDIAPNAPIFRNRSGRAYSKDTLGDDFRAVRAAVDPADERQLADMRRSGAVEGDAGGGSVTDQANKMANSVDTNKRLRKTYNPVNVEAVRRFDEARKVGAKKLEKTDEIEPPILVTLLRFGGHGEG